MTHPDGGAAFPATAFKPCNCGLQLQVTGHATGMSLRDYFAAAALPAVIAAYIEANGRCIGTDHFLTNTPTLAYKFADAMLKERSR